MTTYGMWLRGDQRGWIDAGKLMPPNPSLENADRRRMKFPEYQFSDAQRLVVGNYLGEGLLRERCLRIFALTVRSWHVHFVVGATKVQFGEIAKCAKDSVRYGLKIG